MFPPQTNREPELIWDWTKTVYSKGPHTSTIAVLRSAQTNRTKGGKMNHTLIDSTGLNSEVL